MMMQMMTPTASVRPVLRPRRDRSRRHARASVAGAAALALVLLSGCVVAPRGPRPVYAPHGRDTVAPPVAAAPMYFYPEREQPESRQDRDRYECYRWAVRETGTDPGMTTLRQPHAPAIEAPARDGADVVAGAATGAIVGAAVSGPRHVGENAVIGAIFGAALGAAAQEARAQAVEQAQARRQQSDPLARVPLDNFRRAMSACMQGRGYRVG